MVSWWDVVCVFFGTRRVYEELKRVSRRGRQQYIEERGKRERERERDRERDRETAGSDTHRGTEATGKKAVHRPLLEKKNTYSAAMCAKTPTC